jgi:ATP-binding cassette subfamily B protein
MKLSLNPIIPLTGSIRGDRMISCMRAAFNHSSSLFRKGGEPMNIFVRLLKYIAPHKAWAALAMAMMIFGTAFDLISPYLLKRIFDDGIAESNIRAILLFTALLAVGQILKSVSMYVQNVVQESIGQKVVFQLREELYAKLQRLSFRYYDRAQTGQLMSRITGDIDSVKNFVGFGAMSLLTGGLTFVGTVAFMFAMQWKLTLLCLIPIPLLIAALLKFNRKVGSAWGDIREQMGRLTAILQENISGIRVVKAFAREGKEREKFAKSNEQNYDSNMTRAKLEARSFPAMHFYGGIVFLLMAWIGSVFVVHEEMSLGTLMAFQWYAWGLIWPLNMLGWLINILQQAVKAAPRVFEVLDTPDGIEPPADGGRSADRITGNVSFHNVSFKYHEESPRPILDGIHFEVKAGEVIGILGSTGSGKSTLIQLMPRFYDVSEGAVRIDGIDVRDYNLQQLRAKIGIVPQETFLFSATIRDNIAYGRKETSQEQIEQAARKAQIHDFIMSLPNGYDTIIGERGVGLSGGQRQRIALARAILLDPPILILDEATASVDTVTEAAIQTALDEVMQGRTTFIVAQRLSSVQKADRVIVLEEGKIKQQGTIQELLRQEGFFRNLYELQEAVSV